MSKYDYTVESIYSQSLMIHTSCLRRSDGAVPFLRFGGDITIVLDEAGCDAAVEYLIGVAAPSDSSIITVGFDTENVVYEHGYSSVRYEWAQTSTQTPAFDKLSGSFN
jgi:hypothetical protein